MEKAITGVVDGLLSLGFPGIVILLLCYANWHQWKDRKAMQIKYDDLQNLRVAEGRENVVVIGRITNAMTTLTQVVGLIRQH